MGSDKALLPVGGVPMALLVAQALRVAGCSRVVCIGGDGPALEQLGLDAVVDQYPGEGPLGGVVTALTRFADDQLVAVLACDLPFVTSATVRGLLAAVGSHQVAVARANDVQPLCSVWRTSAAGVLVDVFGGGARRMSAALGVLDVVEVAVDERELLNVNTPDDLGS